MARVPGPAAAITVGRYSAIVGTLGRCARRRSATVTPNCASMAWALAIRSKSVDIPATRHRGMQAGEQRGHRGSRMHDQPAAVGVGGQQHRLVRTDAD